MMRLTNKTALITGSGSGIGQSIAEVFSAEGANVVVMDLLEDRAVRVARQITEAKGQATPMVGDVANRDDVQRIVAETLSTYGQLDILVNNAAMAKGNDIIDLEEAVWDRDMDVVLKSAYLCCQAVLPTMKKQGGGIIINIASVNGFAAYGHMPYSAGKAGVINLTKNMAVNYGEHNIRANAICPGSIYTPIWDEQLKVNPNALEELAMWYPLGRVGKVEDVAKAALFLASDDSTWITGTSLVVDGGLTAGNFRMSRALEERDRHQPKNADA